MERLAKHPEIGGYGEVLLPEALGWSDWPKGAADRPFFTTYMIERNLPKTGWQAHWHLFRYLDYLFEPRRGFAAIGFKLMYNQTLSFPEILAYIRFRRVHVLHLMRRNLLDVALSREAMKKRRFAHARSESEREDVTVSLEPQVLLSELRRLAWERRIAKGLLRAIGAPTHEVTYEDLIADDRRLGWVLGFLGVSPVPPSDLRPVMLKLARGSHAEIIENYSQVEQALRSTPFRKFLRP